MLSPTSIVDDAVVQNPLHVSQERFGRAVHFLLDILNRNGKEILKHLHCKANVMLVQDEILKASCLPFLTYRDPWDEKYTLRNQDAAQDTLASETVLSEERASKKEIRQRKRDTQRVKYLISSMMYISMCGRNCVYTIM